LVMVLVWDREYILGQSSLPSGRMQWLELEEVPL
jgi:hypothetical protein